MGTKINNGHVQGEGGLYTLAANIGDPALQKRADELREMFQSAGHPEPFGSFVLSLSKDELAQGELREGSSEATLVLNLKDTWVAMYGADVNEWPQRLKDSLETINAGVGWGHFGQNLTAAFQNLRLEEATVPAFEKGMALVRDFFPSPIGGMVTDGGFSPSPLWGEGQGEGELIPESAARAGLSFISDPMTLVIPMWAAGTAGRAAAGLLANGAKALQLAEGAATAISVVFSLPVEAAAFVGTGSAVQYVAQDFSPANSGSNNTLTELAASTAFFASLKVFGWMGAVAQGLLPLTEVGMAVAKLTGHASSIFGLAATEELQEVAGIGDQRVAQDFSPATSFYEKLWRAGFLHATAQTVYGIVELKNATSASDEILARSKSFIEALRSNMAQESAGNVIPAGVSAEPAASYWRGDLVNNTVRSEGGEAISRPAIPTAQTIDELEVVITNYEKVKQVGGDTKTVEEEAQKAVLNAYGKALSIIADHENNAIELSDHFLKYIEQIYSGYLRLHNPVMAGSIVKKVIDFLDRVEQTKKPVPAFVSEVASALDKMFKGRSNALTRAIEDHLYKLACILARLKGEPLPPDPLLDGYIPTPEISIAGTDTAEIRRVFTEWVNQAVTVDDVDSFNARLLALSIVGTQNGVEVDRARAVIKYTLLKDLFNILSEKIVNIQGKDKYDERRRTRTIKGLRASISMAEEHIRIYSKEAKPTNAQPELEAMVERGSNISMTDPIAGRDILIEAAEAYVALAEKIKDADEETYRGYCRKAGVAYDWAGRAMQKHAEKIIEKADLLAGTGKNEDARQSYKEAIEALDQAIQYSNKEMILYPEIRKNVEDRLRELQRLRKHFLARSDPSTKAIDDGLHGPAPRPGTEEKGPATDGDGKFDPGYKGPAPKAPGTVENREELRTLASVAENDLNSYFAINTVSVEQFIPAMQRAVRLQRLLGDDQGLARVVMKIGRFLDRIDTRRTRQDPPTEFVKKVSDALWTALEGISPAAKNEIRVGLEVERAKLKMRYNRHGPVPRPSVEGDKPTPVATEQLAPKMPDLKPDIYDRIRMVSGIGDIEELYHKTLADTPEGKAFEALHDGHFSREDIPELVQKTFMLSMKLSAMLERAQILNKGGDGDVLIRMMQMSLEDIEGLLKKHAAPDQTIKPKKNAKASIIAEPPKPEEKK